MSQQSPLSGYVASWGGCNSLEDVTPALTTIESTISAMKASILADLNRSINESNALASYAGSKVIESIEDRLTELEGSSMLLESKVQDYLLASLAPVYTTVNQLISVASQLGFTPIGPLAFQPFIGEQPTKPVEADIPPAPGSHAKPDELPVATTATKPIPLTDKQSAPATNLAAVIPPKENSSELKTLLTNGGIPSTTQASYSMPLWYTRTDPNDPLSSGGFVTNGSRPLSSGKETYGPFYRNNDLEVFILHDGGMRSSDNTIISTAPVDHCSPTPIVVKVTCNCSNGPTNERMGTTELPRVSSNNEVLVGDLGGQAVDPSEYLDWIESSEGLKALTKAYKAMGLTDQDIEAIPVDSFNIKYVGGELLELKPPYIKE